jgi:6-pyruvoyltetrahydropterin/6-carboxytetrahydropterin synthase
MYRITKEFAFCASHHLEGLPDTHPCSRDHGHNYLIKVELSDTKLNETGFVIDYRKLDSIKQLIDETLDHRNLNDVLVCNPTAENIAKELFKTFKGRFPQLTAIEVSETPKTNCRYEQIYDEN